MERGETYINKLYLYICLSILFTYLSIEGDSLFIYSGFILQSGHKHWFSEYWVIVLRRNTELDSYKPLPIPTGYSTSIHWSIYNIVNVYVCLKTLYIANN